MTDCFQESLDTIKEGFYLAQFTDELQFDTWNEDNKTKVYNHKSYLLDLRIFNDSEELHVFRGDISSPFYFRYVNDQDLRKLYTCYFDEEQYLDIDTTRSSGHDVYTTGGGKYNLPYDNINDTKIIIRNYCASYPKTGIAYVSDWRIVGFKRD